MAGWNLDASTDVGYFDEITLGPNEEAVWWFSWGFDSRHWQRMSFAPVGEGRVTIVSEWIRCGPHGRTNGAGGSHALPRLTARVSHKE